MLSSIYYLIAAACAAILVFALKEPLERYLYRVRVESEFLDFLSILLTLEAAGLRLDDVLSRASRGDLVLPSSFSRIAREYEAISRLNPDPYTCIRALSRKVPSSRVASFFRGYSEVLISSSDTLAYVESSLREELKAVESRIDSYSSILDGVFESFLIILLGVLVYASMPIVSIHPIAFSAILSAASCFALLVVYKLLNLAMLSYDRSSLYFTAALALTTPITIVQPSAIALSFSLTLALSAALYLRSSQQLAIESKVVAMLEDLYSCVRQGLSIDSALLKISSKYGYPVDLVARLLKLGFKSSSIIEVLKLPPLSKRVLSLVLAPIECSSGFPRYLGYVLSVVDSVRGLRRALVERSRVYFSYVFVLLFAAVVVFKSFSFVGRSIGSVSYYLVPGITYSSIFESSIVASTISSGYWFRSKMFYLTLGASFLAVSTVL